MSRRESRVSMNVRQNDALFEFENFKKKFLLANKHITKLNSTLSVRIEELNAQISTLYVENLRLRASEIALASQLKREREKSRKIMVEAETATLNLTKHLSYLRHTFNISNTAPAPPTPPSPRARRPLPNTNPSLTSPQGNRISRSPNPHSAQDQIKATTVRIRLPLPSRVSPPPPPAPTLVPTPAPLRLDMNHLATKQKKKPPRRQSGLLAAENTDEREPLSVPRAPSPAFGSPIRREAVLIEDDEIAAVELELDIEVGLASMLKPERRVGKGKGRELESESSEANLQARDKKRPREEDDVVAEKSKMKHLSGSPRNRMALLPIDNTGTSTTYDQMDVETPPSGPFLMTHAPVAQRATSPKPVNPTSDSEIAGTSGRERRTRKSVNYAEPKLNTKMRKPDPPAGSSAPRKRSSAAAIMSTYKPMDHPEDADNDTEARSSLEAPRHASGHLVDPNTFPLPPRPDPSAPLYSPGPSIRAMPQAGSSGFATSVKRKKSRPQILPDDDESDGVQADAEYGGGRGTSGWVNVEGRRKNTHSGSIRRSGVNADDERRHSLAV
ncbi:hypothetical protein BD779DRAFT_1671582 [Infundibulicybe gibba]|nr:hypothetical protein BD779DRAFT_1671582 [Infundibulicybe gibba]